MNVIDKIDKYLNEAIELPSKSYVFNVMSKGLKDVSDVTNKISSDFFHYFDKNILGKKSIIFKTQSSNKLIDELWFKIGKPVEDSEHLTDDGLKKLKKNFYSLGKMVMKYYSYNEKRKGWEYIE